MLNEAALYLAGDRVALGVVSVDEATLKVLLPAPQVLVGSALPRVQAVSVEAVVLAGVLAAAEEVVVVVSVEIEEVSAVDLGVVAAGVEATEVVARASATSPTGMVLQMVHPQDHAVQEVVLAAAAAGEVDMEEAAEAVMATTDAATVIEDQVVRTMNPWAAEIDTVTEIAMVGMAAETTMAHENVGMRVTVMTIRGNDGGTELRRMLSVLTRVCQKVTSPFFALFV